MLQRQYKNPTALIGCFFMLFVRLTEPADDALPSLLDGLAFNREVRRNPKFIIPSLLASMYQKTDRDSIMNTILSRPFAKKVSKEGELKKENSGVEPRAMTGNNKNDHLNQPKTKSPYVKLRESLSNQGEESKSGRNVDNSGDQDVNDGPIEVKKGFSGSNRNWYGDSPVLWAPPIPYPNSYVMPYRQVVSPQRFPSYHEARPPDPMENLYLQDNPIRGSQRGHNALKGKMKAGNSPNQVQTDERDKEIVAQERKYIITNVTKYVLDFYCPHCGGEISVSRAKNKNKMNRGDEITVNKGIYSTINKLEETKNKLFFHNKTK